MFCTVIESMGWGAASHNIQCHSILGIHISNLLINIERHFKYATRTTHNKLRSDFISHYLDLIRFLSLSIRHYLPTNSSCAQMRKLKFFTHFACTSPLEWHAFHISNIPNRTCIFCILFLHLLLLLTLQQPFALTNTERTWI